MGCFSSKHAMRSRSLRHDFSFSMQRRTVGIPGLEDLFTSKATNGDASDLDDFLALLCTANTVAMKLRERDEKLRLLSEAEQGTRLTSDEPVICGHDVERDDEEEQVFHETINTWEILAGLEDADEAAGTSKKQLAHTDDDLIKSAGGSRLVSMGVSAVDQNDVGETGVCAEEKRLSPPPLEDDVPVDKLVIISSESSQKTSSPRSTEPEGCQDYELASKDVNLGRQPLSDIPIQRLRFITENKATSAGTDSMACLDTPSPKGINFPLSFRFKGSVIFDEEESSSGNMENIQKGARRKNMSSDLKPIEVPTFEFKDIQQWFQGDEQGMYDSEQCETPKFGKYIRSIARARRDGNEGLDQELIANLQETIDGMTAEEERILKKFVFEFLENHGQCCGGSL